MCKVNLDIPEVHLEPSQLFEMGLFAPSQIMITEAILVQQAIWQKLVQIDREEQNVFLIHLLSIVLLTEEASNQFLDVLLILVTQNIKIFKRR